MKAFEKDGEAFLASASTGENSAISVYIWRKKKPFNIEPLLWLYRTYLHEPLKTLWRIVMKYVIIPLFLFFLMIAVLDTVYRNVSTHIY